MDQDFSRRLAFGTYEDALRMVGATGEPRTAGTAVSAARIQLFAAMVRDATARTGIPRSPNAIGEGCWRRRRC